MNKNERSRTFTLVINKGANCFNNIKSIVENLNKTEIYALILHDKDIDEKGELKQPHYHLYIKFTNARTCQSILKQFEGAHVEIPINETQSIKYLLHATKNAKAGGKHQYTIEELLTNDINKIKQVLKEDDYPIFIEEEIPTYIAQGITHVFTFIRYFGRKQYNSCWSMYKEVLTSYKNWEDKALVNEVERIKEELGLQDNEEEQNQEEEYEEVKDEDLPF